MIGKRYLHDTGIVGDFAQRRGVALAFLLFVTGCDCSSSCRTGSDTFDGPANQKIIAEPDERSLLAYDPKTGFQMYSTSHQDRVKLSFKNAPPFVRALEMAPKAKEEFLNRDSWLVVVFAIVSVPDNKCAVAAVKGVIQSETVIKLGLRPFLDYDEIKSWHDCTFSAESPRWIIFKDGKVLQERRGILSEREIANMIRETLKE